MTLLNDNLGKPRTSDFSHLVTGKTHPTIGTRICR